jgi:hypothetical protein
MWSRARLRVDKRCIAPRAVHPVSSIAADTIGCVSPVAVAASGIDVTTLFISTS